MMILGWSFTSLWYGILGAVAVLEECCMASADIQWLFYSGEDICGPWAFCPPPLPPAKGRSEEYSMCMSIHVYVTFITSLTNIKVYSQINIDIYVSVPFDCHNLGTFYARKLKFGMLLTQT